MRNVPTPIGCCQPQPSRLPLHLESRRRYCAVITRTIFLSLVVPAFRCVRRRSIFPFLLFFFFLPRLLSGGMNRLDRQYNRPIRHWRFFFCVVPQILKTKQTSYPEIEEKSVWVFIFDSIPLLDFDSKFVVWCLHATEAKAQQPLAKCWERLHPHWNLREHLRVSSSVNHHHHHFTK